MKSANTALWARRYGQLEARNYADAVTMGAAAADDLAAIINQAVRERGLASIIVATGNSQLRFMEALRTRQDIAWERVVVFHMDEYLGMAADHPASFRRYIHQELTDIVRPQAFYGVDGDAPDTAGELARYTALLERYPADACVMGIGENGHLAFNDPPADLTTSATIHVVTLDMACRQQQVGEGHFATLDEVPTHALSLTVPALLKPAHVLVVVPEARKAPAVKAALTGPVTPLCPASVLQTQPQAVVYLEPASAALLP
ncbi:MAG: glucosamine-6-phosphate deaminase [Anaerolineae bacterium]|jgi:glucosamine-6-phosphate deaminase